MTAPLDASGVIGLIPRRAKVAITLLGAMLVAVQGAAVIAVLEAREGAQQREEILLQVQDAAQRLEECTTPGPMPPPATGHECYDRSAERSAAAVSQIVEALTAEIVAALR